MADDFEKWTLDDDFVRSGRHEPAARTRAAIAKHGGERTSWRQPGAPVDQRRPRRRRGGRRSFAPSRVLVGSLLVAGLVALGVWIYKQDRDASGPVGAPHQAAQSTISPDAVRSSVAGGGARDENEVLGINEATAVGTCFSTPAAQQRASYRGSVSLTEVTCAEPHTYELVAHETAAGGADYPDDSYWDGPVARSCQQAFIRYAGARAHGVAVVDGRMSGSFAPQRNGWTDGDRAVYCVARSTLPRTASIRAG